MGVYNPDDHYVVRLDGAGRVAALTCPRPLPGGLPARTFHYDDHGRLTEERTDGPTYLWTWRDGRPVLRQTQMPDGPYREDHLEWEDGRLVGWTSKGMGGRHSLDYTRRWVWDGPRLDTMFSASAGDVRERSYAWRPDTVTWTETRNGAPGARAKGLYRGGALVEVHTDHRNTGQYNEVWRFDRSDPGSVNMTRENRSREHLILSFSEYTLDASGSVTRIESRHRHTAGGHVIEDTRGRIVFEILRPIGVTAGVTLWRDGDLAVMPKPPDESAWSQWFPAWPTP